MRCRVAENLAAQVEHDFLPGPLHEIGLQEFETRKSEDEQSEIDAGDLRDAMQTAAG